MNVAAIREALDAFTATAERIFESARTPPLSRCAILASSPDDRGAHVTSPSAPAKAKNVAGSTGHVWSAEEVVRVA